MALASSIQLHRRESTYLALALIPIGLVVLLVVAGGARQWNASQQVTGEIARLRSAGEPVGNASLTAMLDAETSSENVARWLDLELASSHLQTRFSDIIRKFDSGNRLIAPGTTWQCERVMAKLSERSQPILMQLETLVGRNKTIGLPEIIDGEHGLHSGLGNRIGWLLESEFRYAFNTGDTERALDVLELHIATLKMVAMRFRFNLRTQLVRESLGFDVWDADELDRLRSLISKAHDVDQEWSRTLSIQRAEFLAEVEKNSLHIRGNWNRGEEYIAPFGDPATHVMKQLAMYELAASLRGTGTKEHVEKTEKIERHTQDFSLLSIPLASNDLLLRRDRFDVYNSSVNYYAQLVDQRRTITEIAIKQFKLQAGRWPNSLDELTRVGLTAADWTIIGNATFGYRVIEDGNAALLWSVSLNSWDDTGWFEKGFRVPSTPPSERLVSKQRVADLETRIR